VCFQRVQSSKFKVQVGSAQWQWAGGRFRFQRLSWQFPVAVGRRSFHVFNMLKGFLLTATVHCRLEKGSRFKVQSSRCGDWRLLSNVTHMELSN
jgi:hypothetical protein